MFNQSKSDKTTQKRKTQSLHKDKNEPFFYRA